MNPEVKKAMTWGSVMSLFAFALIIVADIGLHLSGTFVKPAITDKPKVA